MNNKLSQLQQKFKEFLGKLKLKSGNFKLGQFVNLGILKKSITNVRNQFAKLPFLKNRLSASSQTTSSLNPGKPGNKLSLFETKLTPAKVFSAAIKPTATILKSARRFATSETGKFAVAIYDNSPKVVKSWVQGFRGYSLAIASAREQFRVLPEVVKIRARRSIFEVGLVVFLLLVFGLGFGLGLRPKAKIQIYSNSFVKYSENNEWPKYSNQSEMTSGLGSFSLQLDYTSVFNVVNGKRSKFAPEFYVYDFFPNTTDNHPNNVTPSISDDYAKGFHFAGVNVPAMGSTFNDFSTQSSVYPKFPPDAIPGSYEAYSFVNQNVSSDLGKLPFKLSYSTDYNSGATNPTILNNLFQISNKSGFAYTGADATYASNLLGLPNSKNNQPTNFAMYTLWTSDKPNQGSPAQVVFKNLNNSGDTYGAQIVSTVNILLTTCSPETRASGSTETAQVMLLSDTSKNAKPGFSGVVFTGRTFPNINLSDDFSPGFVFSRK